MPELGSLIERTGQGDRAAFAQLVQASRAGVWRVVRSLTADDRAAEDVLQETYLAVWRGAGSWSAQGSGRAWLYGIARRHAARTWRKRAGEPDRTESLEELGSRAGWASDRSPEALAAALEDQERVWAALDAMSVTDREIVVLCDLEGLTGPEAGEVLGLSANAARVRLHRARLHLMARLTEQAHA